MYKLIELTDYEFMEQRTEKPFDYIISEDGGVQGNAFYFLQYDNLRIAIVSLSVQPPQLLEFERGLIITVDNKIVFIFHSERKIKEYSIGLSIYETVVKQDSIWVIGDVEVVRFNFFGELTVRKELPSMIENYQITENEIKIRTDEVDNYVIKLKR